MPAAGQRVAAAAPRVVRTRSDYLQSLRSTQAAAIPAEARARVARLRQPDRAGRAAAGRDGARPRLGRRHRRAALGRRVGPTGKAYGLDMTDEMLALARENQRSAGVDERRVPEGRDRAHPAARQLGGRDHLELRHQSLGGQGPRARRGVPRAEAGRALRGIGRRRARRACPRRSAAAWSCGSAASRARWRSPSIATSCRLPGSRRSSVEPTRIYRAADARQFLTEAGLAADDLAPEIDGRFMSAFIRARKPLRAAACCGPSCCQ